jgi:DNA-directed RNA polymerase III subunit RPC1
VSSVKDKIAKSKLLKKAIEKAKDPNRFIQTIGDDIIQVLPDMNTNKENILFQLEKLRLHLPSILIRGVADAKRAAISIVKEDPMQYGLVIEGTNLEKVMTIPGVIGELTTSNDIIEVERVLGIEAARASIINEISSTMKSHGIAVDTRHVMLLADIMTFRGQVLGIQRHGMQKMKDR